MQLYAFDIMALDGDETCGLPLSMRRAYPPRGRAEYVRCALRTGEIGPDASAPPCDIGLRGLLSMRRDRPYQAHRSKHWVKVKDRKHLATEPVISEDGDQASQHCASGVGRA